MNGEGSGSPQPEVAIENVLSMVRELLEMDVAFVSEFDGDRLAFRAVEGDKESFGFEEGGSIPLERSYCKRVIDGRIFNAVPDSSDEEQVRDLEVTRDANIGSYVGVPVRLSDGRLYGTLCCLSHSPDPWLKERDLQLMHKLADDVAQRLEKRGLL